VQVDGKNCQTSSKMSKVAALAQELLYVSICGKLPDSQVLLNLSAPELFLKF